MRKFILVTRKFILATLSASSPRSRFSRLRHTVHPHRLLLVLML